MKKTLLVSALTLGLAVTGLATSSQEVHASEQVSERTTVKVQYAYEMEGLHVFVQDNDYTKYYTVKVEDWSSWKFNQFEKLELSINKDAQQVVKIKRVK